jgi:His-Xaa-Ser system protein HxsD
MPPFEKECDATSLAFDRHTYSLTAVKKAAYKYLDRFSADITIEDKKITCILRFTSSGDSDARARLVEDFRKEVLDQDLRETIKAETEAVRNLILAYAFSQTAILSNEKI